MGVYLLTKMTVTASWLLTRFRVIGTNAPMEHSSVPGRTKLVTPIITIPLLHVGTSYLAGHCIAPRGYSKERLLKTFLP